MSLQRKGKNGLPRQITISGISWRSDGNLLTAVANTQRVLWYNSKPGRIDARDWPWYFREQNVCTKRSSGGEAVAARRTSGQERGQRNRVDAPWPRRCIHDIIYPCSLALCLCSCIRKRCASLQPLQRFIRLVQTAKEFVWSTAQWYVAAGIPTRTASFFSFPFPTLPIILPTRLFSRHFN